MKIVVLEVEDETSVASSEIWMFNIKYFLVSLNLCEKNTIFVYSYVDRMFLSDISFGLEDTFKIKAMETENFLECCF